MNNLEFDGILTSCILCNSKKIRLNLIDHRGIKISKCSNCGIQFMNPQYSDAYLDEYYSNYTSGDDYSHWHEALLYGHDFYFSLIEKYADVGEVLDIGCGGGYLLEAAKKRGWQVRGFDVDEGSTKKVGDRLGVEVDHGNFFLSEPGSDYDLVTMHQVLEHLKKPNEYLKRIHSIVKKNGHVFIAVPNIKSLANKIKRFLEKKGIRKKSVGKYYDTSHHILYFEPEILGALLESHGFKVVYQRNCHSTKPGQSKLKRFLMRNFTDYFFSKSAFFIIAKKIS